MTFKICYYRSNHHRSTSVKLLLNVKHSPEQVLQNDVFLMYFFPELCIMRGNNTLAEGSGSFVNEGKHTYKVFT